MKWGGHKSHVELTSKWCWRCKECTGSLHWGSTNKVSKIRSLLSDKHLNWKLKLSNNSNSNRLQSNSTLHWNNPSKFKHHHSHSTRNSILSLSLKWLESISTIQHLKTSQLYLKAGESDASWKPKKLLNESNKLPTLIMSSLELATKTWEKVWSLPSATLNINCVCRLNACNTKACGLTTYTTHIISREGVNPPKKHKS